MSSGQPGGSQIQLIQDIGEEPSFSCLIQASFPLPAAVDIGALDNALVSKIPAAVKAEISRGTSVPFGAFGRMLDNVLPLDPLILGTGGVANRIVATDFAEPNAPQRSVTLETRVFLKPDADGPTVFTQLQDAVAQRDVTQVVTVLADSGNVTAPTMLRALVAAALDKPFP